MTWQKQIRDLLVNDELKKALVTFAARPEVQRDGSMQNTLIMLQAQANGYINKANAGLLSESQANLQKNQIRHRILGVLESFPETAADDIGEAPVNGGTTPAGSGKTTPTAPMGSGAPKLLFLASNPAGSGKLQLNKEFALISNMQQDSRFRSQIHSDFATTQMGMLQSIMKYRPTYLHFACHGTDGEDDYYPEGLLLEDGKGNADVFPASALASILGSMKGQFPIDCVLLNACGTEEHASKISEQGITAIGMQGDWPDEDALAFASVFYMTLSQSEDVNMAFNLATTMVNAKRPGKEPIPRIFTA